MCCPAWPLQLIVLYHAAKTGREQTLNVRTTRVKGRLSEATQPENELAGLGS